MIFIQADITSAVLARTMSVNLFFPNSLVKENPQKAKAVITLLHGFGNNQQHWTLFSSAPRFAAENDLILIMPVADNSFYNNMAHGAPFYDWITKEMPAQLSKIFKIPAERDKNFIAGLSMGGYGALRIGLANPDKFAACGSFSGAMDLGNTTKNVPSNSMEYPLYSAMLTPVFGSGIDAPKEADLFHLTEEISKLPAEQQPRIFQTCGKQDYLYDVNEKYRDFALGLPIDFTYKEWDGVHEWKFWDRSLAEFIGLILDNDYGTAQAQKMNFDYAPK